MRSWPHGSEGAAKSNVDLALSTLVARLIAVTGIVSIGLAGCAPDSGAGGSGGLALSARWERRTAEQSAGAGSCAGFDSETDVPEDVRAVRVVVQSDPTDPRENTSCCRVDVEDPAANRQVAIRQILQGMVAFKVDAFDRADCRVPLAPDDLCGSAESVESCATTGAAPTPATPAPSICPAGVTPIYSSDTVNEVIAAGQTKRVGVCMKGNSQATPTVTATPTVSGTPTITAVDMGTPTNFPTSTSTDTPPTAIATETATSSPPTPTATSSPPTPTATSSPPTPTATSSLPTPTVTSSPPTPTATSSPPTPTVTSGPPTPTATSSPPTPTGTEATATDTPDTVTPTATITLTPPDTPTATITLTPPDTPTATHTASPTTSPALGGHIHYYTSVDLPVPAVDLGLIGGTSAAAITDVAGDFGFAVVADGMQTLQPAKHGDFRIAITSLDASFILRFVAGMGGFTADQRLAADVTGDGTISSLDATRILAFQAGVELRLPVAILCDSDWVFRPSPVIIPSQTLVQPQISDETCVPAAIVYGDLFTPPAAGQDFVAVLFGDVTGNWSQSTPEFPIAPPTPTAAGPVQ